MITLGVKSQSTDTVVEVEPATHPALMGEVGLFKTVNSYWYRTGIIGTRSACGYHERFAYG